MKKTKKMRKDIKKSRTRVRKFIKKLRSTEGFKSTRKSIPRRNQLRKEPSTLEYFMKLED